MKFTHLHLHTQYSLLESSITAEDLMPKVLELGMDSVAQTDNGNMFGTIEFYLEAKMAGVKPIIGCDLYIAPYGRFEKGAVTSSGVKIANPQSFPRLVLLAQNLNGYKNLCQIVSRGYTEGFYYRPRIDYEVLKLYSSDLIALTSSVFGDVPQAFFNGGPEKALEKIHFYRDLYGDRFYLEISRNGAPQQEALNRFFIETGKNLGIGVVATAEPHYLKQDDAYAQEVMLCIGSSKTLGDDRRPKLPSDQFYLKSPEEMFRLFKDIPEACERTTEVAERCQLQFKFTDDRGNTIYHLPSFPVSEGKTIKDEMRELATQGLEKRFEEAALRNEPVAIDERPKYFSRLEFELNVIDRMGFNGYFLIVADFINFAKSKDIPVGPGRGSGAGSLVAYSLRITDLDPLKYNLLFERFLNPERISMPDFDVDFCQDRRGEVIQYVTEKYGSQCVAQIITFGKLQARAALRDVGRAMGMSFSEVDVIAKLIPEKLGISLQEAIDLEPKLREASENDPKVDSLLKTAQKLEGLGRHASIHAAGVIISDRPLVEHCPLYKGNEGETVIQYDMVRAEQIGLIKFDFLGLKTLTMISNAIKNVHRNRPHDERAQKLSTNSISLNDPKIYELLSRGDTAGVFQFEGDGISDLIQKFKPNCFEDITAINALYRPGPMNMLDEYVARKHGKIKVSYIFPVIEDILKETYGIIVYQEQVQLIAAKCANYSLGEADILRRAMGKKKASEMAAQRERFLKGAAENKLDPKKAGELFDLMAKFAEYGFNKSHASAYCVIAAQTAYLKAYYPVEFYASLITTEMADTDKLVKYIRDAGEHGIKVRGPDVNHSQYQFAALGDEIVFGLGGVKGIGEAAVQAIVEARESKPNKCFDSLSDFFESVDLRRVNKKVIECLVKAGAFDNLHSHRAQIIAGLEKIIDFAESKRRDRELGQTSLFDLDSKSDGAPSLDLPQVEPWSRTLRLSNEREVLGFYMSDHPLAGFESILKNHVQCLISGLQEAPVKKKISIGGIIGGLKEFITKKGTRMAFAQLEDQTGVVELVIFSEAFTKYQHLLKGTQPLVVTGQHERENNTSKILVDQVTTIQALAAMSKEVVVRLKAGELTEKHIKLLKSVLAKHKGEMRSRIEVQVPELKKTIQLDLGPEYGVNPSEAFFEDLESHLGVRGLAGLQ
ncbi:MAG: DNA polymerase III subunit alpha [Oligoflexia bacterium]|nr:DNA polymerase III subunit alpha [Oligoflexia bacterium]